MCGNFDGGATWTDPTLKTTNPTTEKLKSAHMTQSIHVETCRDNKNFFFLFLEKINNVTRQLIERIQKSQSKWSVVNTDPGPFIKSQAQVNFLEIGEKKNRTWFLSRGFGDGLPPFCAAELCCTCLTGSNRGHRYKTFYSRYLQIFVIS